MTGVPHQGRPTRPRTDGPARRVAAVAIVAALLAGACSGDDGAAERSPAGSAPVADAPRTSTTTDETSETGTTMTQDLTTDAVAALTDEEVLRETYVAGYPLLVSMRTLQRFGGLIGVNRLLWQSSLAGPETRLIVAPNRDTLYSVAVLDLRDGPLTLTLPAIDDRYHAYQFLDAWTESFAYVGTRATGGRAGTWVVTPPGWTGELPAGAEQLEAPTPLVFLLGRFLVDDEADIAAVTAISDDVSLTPLAGPGASPPSTPLGSPLGTAQEIPTDATFFDELVDALAVNPPSTEAQRALFARAAELGVEPGSRPSEDPERAAALDDAAAAGWARIEGAAGSTTESGGWGTPGQVGTYGDDLLQRALVARVGWGANVPEEAVYSITRVDAAGDPLDGSRAYRLRFPPGELPPVDAFWSLTVYGEDLFFAPTPTDRYAIGDRTPGLTREPDGSLELVLSPDEPAAAADGRPANWLPVPDGRFVLMLRLYLPRPEILDGSYRFPAVEPDA